MMITGDRSVLTAVDFRAPRPIEGAAALIRVFGRIAQVMEIEKGALCMLDGAIGDADHGITMVLGFRAVTVALGRFDRDQATPSVVLEVAATAFLDAVGASTGPLYATGFRDAAHALEACSCFDTAAQFAMLDAIGTGIRRRGRGERGDKTMLDVWLPAAEAGADALRAGRDGRAFWRDVVTAADAGVEATRSMVAARGRAARVGRRSLGHTDPGAASAALIVTSMQAELGTA